MGIFRTSGIAILASSFLGSFAFAQNSEFGKSPGKAVLERFNDLNRLTQEQDYQTTSTINYSGAFEADKPLTGQSIWAAAGFHDAKFLEKSLLEVYTRPAPPNTLYLDFTALILKVESQRAGEFNWSPESTKAALLDALPILDQCNIRISRVRYFWSSSPDNQVSFISDTTKDKGAYARKIPAQHRPMAIFAKKLWTNPNDSTDKEYGVAFKAGSISSSPVNGTMFIAADAYNERIFRKDSAGNSLPSRNTLAHELVHTLGFHSHCGIDAGDGWEGVCAHPEQPNLMSSRNNEYSEFIPPDICQEIRKSPLLRPKPLP